MAKLGSPTCRCGGRAVIIGWTMSDRVTAITNLGVVAFLNARPLIEGLDADPHVRLHYAVPAALPGMLKAGQVDAALVPVIDLARADGAWEQISDAGIGCDGETLTVRVFSRVPPRQMTTLHVDGDSHTSVALAQLIWRHWYKRPIQTLPLADASALNDCESVLLIGDKVVTTPTEDFEHTIDLGEAWKAWTSLPFVFAVWAAPAGRSGNAELGRLLAKTRDHGLTCVTSIAARHGPPHGWPIELAMRYLTECMAYKITPAARQGMARFVALAANEGLVPNADGVAR